VLISAPGLACRQAESSPRQRRLNERLPGLSPVLLLEEAFALSPSTGFTPALRHYSLFLPLQTEGQSLSPCFRSKALDRIAGLLALKRLTYNVSRFGSDYSTKPPSSTEKPLSWHPALRVGIWRMVTPASFHRVGSPTTPVDAVHPNHVR